MRKLINYKLLFLSPFFLAACSNEDNIHPPFQPAGCRRAGDYGGGDAYEKRDKFGYPS